MAKCSKCSKFGIGLISGIVIGMLTAPVKGSKLRGSIRKNTYMCKNRIESLFNRGKDELDEIKEALEDSTNEVTSEVREKLLKLIDETKKSIEENDD
ncbi:MAG TPA: YtxH domain-containing protein [Chitinophagaceae bacterium]|nr:YtxH domain-containing protein [Chitinophagaceae bacterium]